MKVMEMISASSSLASVCCRTLLFLKNLMLPKVKIFVVFISLGEVVREYLHDCMVKKNAPMISSVVAIDTGSADERYSLAACLITETGIAFCHSSLVSDAL